MRQVQFWQIRVIITTLNIAAPRLLRWMFVKNTSNGSGFSGNLKQMMRPPELG